MATANEKLMASIIYDLCNHLMLLEDDKDSLDELSELQNKVAEIITQEEKKGMSWDDRYYYTGCNILDMREEERPEVCEFIVTHYGKEVLHFYYDRTLQFILQPNGDGFSVAQRRPLCGRAQLRNTLAKLAKAEEAEPGTYAKRFYVPQNYLGKPTIFKDKNVIEEDQSVEAE
jgi:hypothetical protein